MVKLYKIVSCELVLVGYGVVSKMEEYAKRGYIVVKEEELLRIF